MCHVSNIRVITWWPSHQHLQPVGVPVMKYLPVHHSVWPQISGLRSTVWASTNELECAVTTQTHPFFPCCSYLVWRGLLPASFLFLAAESRGLDFWFQQIIRQTSKGFLMTHAALPARARTCKRSILVYQLNNWGRVFFFFSKKYRLSFI